MDIISKYPPNVYEQLNLFINNVKYLMRCVIVQFSLEEKEYVVERFKLKLQQILTNLLKWYKVYKESIPDALLMIYEQHDKVERLSNHEHKTFNVLNYKINQEIYHCMERIYNL